MTQQPQYPQQYAPQYPTYPQQQAPAYPGYPPQNQGYNPQQYGPPPGPPAQPTQPLAQGTLDDYFNQPGAAGGPSISWSTPQGPKPIGTSYAGIVARPVTQADVQQQTDPNTQQRKFFRDGRPMFVLTVPLKVQPSQEFPQGEATWFVRGQARDELVRAMAEAGAPAGPPEHGAAIRVTLVQRRPSRMGNPANIVQVQYARPQGAAPAHAGGPDVTSPAPGPVAPPTAPEGPPPNTQPQPPADYNVHYPQPQQGWAPAGTVNDPYLPPAPAQPAQPQPQALQPPADFDQAQKELLARLTGQTNAAAPQAQNG